MPSIPAQLAGGPRWLPGLLIGTPLFLALLAWQNAPASIGGTVTDRNGNALPRVRITLLDAGMTPNGAIRFTDQQGAYKFDGLLPGKSSILLEAVGYRTEKRNVAVGRGRKLRLDARLKHLPAHRPVPLLDWEGNAITSESTTPFNGRQTCGPCHDIDTITNGYHFQQGRTDSEGHVINKSDFFDDGRYWIRSPGRMGQRSQTGRQFAAKNNVHESDVDLTTPVWVRSCGGCHPGGGQGEFDLDGQLLYDREWDRFGYEAMGKTEQEARLDTDYWEMDVSTGTATQAPWDKVGLLDPDCLLCHRTRTDPVSPEWYQSDLRKLFAFDTIRTRRAAVMYAYTELRDKEGQPVPALAAAATAGQGWFSELDLEGDGPPTLQIDYTVGLADGSLILDQDGKVNISPEAISAQPTDRVCWGCHVQGSLAYGNGWFDTRDVHYKHFNRLDDEDPENDIPPEKSTLCIFCHSSGLDHNFAKGNSPQLQHRNDHDYANFRSCRDCHMDDSPMRDHAAPEVPGDVLVHITPPMLDVLSCQACHIPYTLHWVYYFMDMAAGRPKVGKSLQYFSSDPLDPSKPDKSRWYPPFLFKKDSDGKRRLFPWTPSLAIYWADWDQKGTPDDLSDDIIAPLINWRVLQAFGGGYLPVVTDDNGDGVAEVNRPDEILASIEALKGRDRYGRQVAARPVLVKGTRVWFEDPNEPQGVGSFEHEGTGIPIDWTVFRWGINHDVLPTEEAWGYDANDPGEGCLDCHPSDTEDSPVFDRLVLIDPYGPDGKPVYTTVREMTGLDPRELKEEETALRILKTLDGHAVGHRRSQ